MGISGCRVKIVPTQFAVTDGDFAYAFADLEALEPVASECSAVFDPGASFGLGPRAGQGAGSHPLVVADVIRWVERERFV